MIIYLSNTVKITKRSNNKRIRNSPIWGKKSANAKRFLIALRVKESQGCDRLRTELEIDLHRTIAPKRQ
jgi:hypothetical protein